jgi:hypothetical protein
MLAKVLPHREERWFLTVSEQHLRPLHSACRLASRARDDRQPPNLLIGHRQLDHLPPSCHDAIPRSVNPKRGIHKQITSSMPASFMESVV